MPEEKMTPITSFAGGRSIIVALALTASLASCGGSSTATGAISAHETPNDYPGTTNTVPEALATGMSRAGKIYDVYIESPKTGDKVAFSVFEPTTLTGGKTYPLILHSHGFGGNRQKAGNDSEIAAYVAQGYGVISIDERGHGESGGTIRVMDPDAEGQNLLAVIDWAEARLGWLKYGLSADGRDAHNLVLGSMGSSYGGMFQYLIHNIDPRRRLDAMTPEASPNNLNFSLFPGTVSKTLWNAALLAVGNVGGAQNSKVATYDPYIQSNFPAGLLTGVESSSFNDFFYYHSNEYFCGSTKTVATNGGDGIRPSYAPMQGSKVNIMFYQGVRDTLFNLSDGINNYECAQRSGGDVRFLSYQTGHNSLGVVPDPGMIYLGGPDAAKDNRCGSLSVNDARLAFFDEHLKGIAHAADKIPIKPCLSLQPGSAVLVNHILHAASREGTEVAIPATQVITGLPDVPIAIDLGIVGGDAGTLIAGIPHLKVSMTPAVPGTPGMPTVFIGLGQTRGGVPGVYDLINQVVMPLYGAGEHAVDLIAIAAKLAKGEKLALLIYGLHDQFAITGITASQVPVMPVSIAGKIRLPVVASDQYVDAP